MEGQNKKGKDRLMCLEILKHQEICTFDEFSS